MNALEVPVTNCHVGMNKQGLPIGIQVLFNQFSSKLVILFFRSKGTPYCQLHQNIL